MSFSIHFKSTSTVGDHIEYIIEVTNSDTGEICRFLRRYSTLRDIHTQFKSLSDALPNFPPKKLFGNKHPKFLEQRRMDLEHYFIECLKIPGILNNSICTNFLAPRDKEIINSASAKVARPQIPAVKKSRLENEVKETSKKVTDGIVGKLFDLSVQPMPLDEDELKTKAKYYHQSLGEVKIQDKFGLPLGSEVNGTLLVTEVQRQEWVTKMLGNCLTGLPNVFPYAHAKFLD